MEQERIVIRKENNLILLERLLRLLTFSIILCFNLVLFCIFVYYTSEIIINLSFFGKVFISAGGFLISYYVAKKISCEMGGIIKQ